jgi:hypothetical protein
MDTAFVQDLVVITVANENDKLMTKKVVMKSRLRDFVNEMVAMYGVDIFVFQNKAYISYTGAIEAGEYLGTIDCETLLME